MQKPRRTHDVTDSAKRAFKRFLYWVIAIAVVLQLFSCITGGDTWPGKPF